MKKLIFFFGILVCATKISSAQNNQFDWSLDDVLSNLFGVSSPQLCCERISFQVIPRKLCFEVVYF